MWKGLWQKSALGRKSKQFTGISDPYEAPIAPEVTIDSSSDSIEESVTTVLRCLEEPQDHSPSSYRTSNGSNTGEVDTNIQLIRA